MKTSESFFAGSVQASLPLWLWALHFAFCYVAVAVGCHAGWHLAVLAGFSLLQWLLVAASVLACLAGAELLRRARAHAAQQRDGLLGRVRLLAALLGLVGIVWTAVPTLLLPVCHLT